MKDSIVYVQQKKQISYPKRPPFHPSEIYPEYPFKEISREKNYVYSLFRNLLFLMYLDRENFNSKNWNPFKNFIFPGNTVLIKPNFVINSSTHQNAITTHSSILRAIIDYVIIALKGKGKITIGDAPLQQCDFERLVIKNGLKNIINFIKLNQVDITLTDFRTEMLKCKVNRLTKRYRYIKPKKLKGDINGFQIIDLHHNSNLHEISKGNNYKNFRVTNYDPTVMKTMHSYNNHKYLISNSLLQSDVVINVPKIKTHRKAGITACLKNCVGINGHKDWLPHHQKGSRYEGGDEYLFSNICKKIYNRINELDDKVLTKSSVIHNILFYPFFILKVLIHFSSKLTGKDPYFEGSWHGNDTLWRTIADLNQILLYVDKNGKFSNEPQRKRVYFCDGIIIGEKEGPIRPSPKKIGLLVGGFDPLMVDLAITELINFDYLKIPQLYKIFNIKNRKISQFNPQDLMIKSNNSNWDNKKIDQITTTFKIQPTRGWKSYIEKDF